MGSPGGGVDSGSGPSGGGGPDRDTDRPDDNDRGGSRDDKASFDRAMDNANRPDRAPASPPESTTSTDEDDDQDAHTTDTPDDRSDRAAGPPGIGAPPSSTALNETSDETDERDDRSFFDRVADTLSTPAVDSYGNRRSNSPVADRINNTKNYSLDAVANFFGAQVGPPDPTIEQSRALGQAAAVLDGYAIVPATMPANRPPQGTPAYDAAIAMANAEFGVSMEVMRHDLNRDIDKAVASYDQEIAAIDDRLAEIDAELNSTSPNGPTAFGTLASIPPAEARSLIEKGGLLKDQRAELETKRNRAEEARGLPDQLDMMHIARDVYGAETALANSHISRLSDQELKDLGLEPSLFEDQKTGFHAEVYRNTITDQVVLAFEGTDPESLPDLKTDGLQALGLSAPQYEQAEKLAEQFDIAFAGENRAMTGHSLGGGLAAYAGLAEGIEATTFNAAGLHAQSLENLGVTREEALEIVDAYHVEGEILSWAQDSTAADLIATGILGTGYAAYSDFDPVPAAVGERHAYQARNSQGESPRFGGGALRPGDLAKRVDLHEVLSVLHSIRAELNQAQREIDPT